MSIEKARSAKQSKARCLARLRAGRVAVADLIWEPPNALGGVDLYEVLLCTPGMGRDRTRVTCERANIWPHLTLGELTKQQRAAVLANLPNGYAK